MSQPQAAPATPEAEILDTVSKLAEKVDAAVSKITDLERSNEEFRKNPFPAPHARKGEDPLSSRPYSYLKALGVIAGQVSPDDAKTEIDIAHKLKAHNSGFKGYPKSLPNSLMLPLAADFVVGDEKLADEVRQVTKAWAGADPDETAFLRRKMQAAGLTKALSWLDETAGGALVAPPAMGELIELLRNNEVLMAAGARVMPLPPQGRITFPRQTTPGTAYHVGESTDIPESQQGTGDVVLSAKKLTTLCKIPNELFHFSAIPIEGFVREDMAKVMALKMDVTLLEAEGDANTPKGLIRYSSINAHTSNGTPANANSGYPIHPRDPYEMVAKVQEQNADFKGFIMRPLLWAGIVNKRADAVVAGDQAGPFLFNVWREPGVDMSLERLKVGTLAGYPVYKSTQVSTKRERGSSGQVLTYVLGGNFADYLIALGAAVEFAVSTQGDSPFVKDQTWFRGVTYYDGAPRHEASFVLMDQLTQTGF